MQDDHECCYKCKPSCFSDDECVRWPVDITYFLLLYIRRLWFIKRQKPTLNAAWHHPSSRFIHYIILNCPNDPGIPVTLNAHLRLYHCIFRSPEGLLIWLLAWYL